MHPASGNPSCSVDQQFGVEFNDNDLPRLFSSDDNRSNFYFSSFRRSLSPIVTMSPPITSCLILIIIIINLLSTSDCAPPGYAGHNRKPYKVQVVHGLFPQPISHLSMSYSIFLPVPQFACICSSRGDVFGGGFRS